MVVELLEGWIDTTTTNGVHWGTRFALVAALLHFLKLKNELELLGSGCNVDQTKDQVNALLTRVCTATDSLALHVPPLVALKPPNIVRARVVVVVVCVVNLLLCKYERRR
jgi:hypothetical protein